MQVTIVHVQVKSGHIQDFIAATQLNHEASIQESGNLRFDILQSAEDPAKFILYEAYRDQGSADAHKESLHYLSWRDSVADWMEIPRQGEKYNGIFPVM